MQNQHQKIKGYRDLSQAEIDLMNEIKAKGEELEALVEKVRQHISTQTLVAEDEQDTDGTEKRRIDRAQPFRWAAIAGTDFQTGLMALTRSVAQPTTF